MRDALCLRFYRRALALYPSAFREAYAEQALIAVRDWYADTPIHDVRFYFSLGRDLAASLANEHTRQLRRQVMKQPIAFHTAGLIVIVTVLGGVVALTGQQLLRRGADQPQKQMIESYASRLGSGRSAEQVIPAGHIDIAQSLEPFLIAYDDNGTPISANATLDNRLPAPPRGVFDHARQTGSDTLTWQPRPGVRIATVVRRISGAQPGFLLAGRSLRQVEESESLWWRLSFSVWLAIMLLLAGSGALLNRATRPPLPA
jgi:hypothetical protein